MVLKTFLNSYQGPAYVYDLEMIQHRARLLREKLFPAKVFYAVKANYNTRVLEALRSAGCGADVVSGGEIHQAEKSGYSPQEIIFSSVGKTRSEIRLALEKRIYQINVESLEELKRIGEIARALRALKAPVALRVNPNINIQTHPYIATGLKENKFGISTEMLSEGLQILRDYADVIDPVGLSMHLGSQMLEFSGFEEALRLKKNLFWELKKTLPSLRRFDFGGGLGIYYDQDRLDLEEQMLEDYADRVKIETRDLVEAGVELQTEPGRWIVGHGGVLLAQVQYVKRTPHKTFIVLDTGMHHLLRPALYQAEHRIYPLRSKGEFGIYDFVGPICESGDTLGYDRLLPVTKEGDILLIANAGAYGYCMSSNYNLRPPAQEIILD